MKWADKARTALESTYTGVCSVYEYGETTDPETHITTHGEKKVLENIPCRLSFSRIEAAENSGGAATAAQSVKLFISPDVSIKSGSKISVTQNGVTTEYASSGVPAVYPTHQEIMLELFRGWA